MEKDVRETDLYQEIEKLYTRLRRPGAGQVSDASELEASPDGKRAVFTGVMVEKLEGTPSSCICAVDLTNGETKVLTFGPNTDRSPKYSPDGDHVAFLSDREKRGNFQLYLLNPSSGAARRAPVVEGWVEYLHWSPDGGRILLGVAGHGADIASGQGAVSSKKSAVDDAPSWLPEVETGDESYRWRSAWIYDLRKNEVSKLESAGLNIWEAVWCGDDKIAAVTSPGPSEALWYTATLHIIDIESGAARELYRPQDQLGWPAASPSGRRLAIVEAVCSDRGIAAGDLLLIDPATGDAERIDTNGVDVAFTQWRSEERLLFGGCRSFETVILESDVRTGVLHECWSSEEISCGVRYPALAPSGDGIGDCLFIGEGFFRAPEIAAVRNGVYSTIKSFDSDYDGRTAEWVASAESITWTAPDGLKIHGWLLRPRGNGPYPLVLEVHGGPVWTHQPGWFGRGSRSLAALALLKHGYAIFKPNPRGSSGRGKEFARLVVGDVGGAEMLDHLSGLDYLVGRGVADPDRIGIMGGSHGGYMTSWTITQDQRFAAAVSVAPVTDWCSQHLTSNIPHFDLTFLNCRYGEPGNLYFTRSPIMHAAKAKTPTLSIAGALDKCTPPTQAVEFHNALIESGVKSALVIYPQEGHGVRELPAAIDYVSRIVAWFDEHMHSVDFQ